MKTSAMNSDRFPLYGCGSNRMAGLRDSSTLNQNPMHYSCGSLKRKYFCAGSIAATGSYTESSKPIYINDLNCTGSEGSVWECPHNGIERYLCNHRQDASVACQGQ